MEILIGIMPLIVFIVFSIIIFIQDWITDCRKMQRELDRIRVSFCKVDCLPIGELESDKVYIFSESKVGAVTGTSLLCNEELEEIDEAERLIKEAKEKKV